MTPANAAKDAFTALNATKASFIALLGPGAR
jgi:hypothetical protein